MENLKLLFVEVINASLSKNTKNTDNTIKNTIKHFAQYEPFNTITLNEWYCICLNNGIEFKF